ncbi:MAG: RNase adapter RapZ [Proteobacteria bacterium]|nr:MAG: RNase adapter RapZ [Pseudomonadota bacterium]
MKRISITIITGRSGSGKSTALAAFEDAGYYCVDNMPVALLPRFLDLCPESGDAYARLVFGMDLREASFTRDQEAILSTLRRNGFSFRIVFLEADEKVLLRRYSQTRRAHPLARQGRSLHEAIRAEAALLASLRHKADHIIDTTDLTVHDLKAVIRKLSDVRDDQASMNIQLISFGFKYGLPVQADLVMDVRFLVNPYFVESLRHLSGESEKIRSFVLNNDQTCLFLHKYFDLIDILIPLYANEGKSYLTIAIGCTGGRHRSVVIAGQLWDHLTASGLNVSLTHRDIDKSLST